MVLGVVGVQGIGSRVGCKMRYRVLGAGFGVSPGCVCTHSSVILCQKQTFQDEEAGLRVQHCSVQG